MKAILYIVTILVVGGGIYFTLDHSNKFTRLQQDRLATIEKNKEVSANAAVTEKKLSDEKAILVAVEQKKAELTQSVEALESTGAGLKRDAAELDNTLKTQVSELAELEKTLKTVIETIGKLGTDITLDNLGEKIQEIEATKKAKQTELEELLAKIADSEKSLAVKRAEADRAAKHLVERKARIGRNSLEAVVTQVDQDWGILIIGAGSNTGFTPQTSLIVMRDGRMIGRVLPSSIEPNQTIAEIDFKTLAAGVRLQPGDKVMLTKPNSN